MHPFFRGSYIFSLHAIGIIGEAVRPGRRGVVGLHNNNLFATDFSFFFIGE